MTDPRDDQWRRHAACRDEDRDIFFPTQGASVAEAKAICATCPVRRPCAEHAITHPEPFGIWGGLSERQRRQIRRQRGLRNHDLDD